MTFEEEFPELAKYWRRQIKLFPDKTPPLSEKYVDGLLIELGAVTRNCLSKQRVKQAIHNLPDDEEDNEGQYFKKKLLQELGLEEK